MENRLSSRNLHINTIATSASGVYVARGIRVDAVRDASVGVREELPVVQPLTVFGDVEAVDGGWGCLVVLAGESVDAGVSHVDVLEVGAVEW